MATERRTEQWTEHRVFERLKGPFPSPAFVLLPQVRNGTGYKRRTTRTADALAISVWPSRGLFMTGFEIKVSKSDWRKELSDPSKSEDIQQYCKHWYIAAPKGVVPEGELPPTWGLIECTANSARIVKTAAELTPKAPDMLLLCSILRTASEVMVPADGVRAQVKEQVDQAVEYATQSATSKHEELRKAVDAFQEASGVEIDSWYAGNIGEAVKMVLASQALGH